MFLYLAERFLDGAQLYVDILEINPPLIYYLFMVPVWLSRKINLPVAWVFYLFVISLAALSSWLCWRLWQQVLPSATDITRRTLILVLIFCLMVYFLGNFGHREHLIYLLIMPYVFAAAVRSENQPISRIMAISIGIMAGLAIALKPYFLFLWLGLEMYLAFVRGSWSLPIREENIAIFLVLSLLLAIYLSFWPNYFKFLVLMLPVYITYARSHFQEIFLRKEVWLWFFTGLSLWWIKPPVPDRKVINLLFMAATLFLGIAVSQKKADFNDHWYPAFLTLVLLISQWFLRWLEVSPGLAKKWRLSLNRGARLLIAGLIITCAVKSVRHSIYSRLEELDSLIKIVRQYAQGKTIYVMSLAVKPTFPLVNDSGVSFLVRYPCLWPLPAFYPNYGVDSGKGSFHALSRMTDLERSFMEGVVADLQAHPPILIIIDNRRIAQCKINFSLLEYFSQHPRFAELMTNYNLLSEVAPYTLFIKNKRIK
ncbi:MAG: hypothetical protein ACOZF2_02975 [Thermodesulfobacteriota bacterium]